MNPVYILVAIVALNGTQDFIPLSRVEGYEHNIGECMNRMLWAHMGKAVRSEGTRYSCFTEDEWKELERTRRRPGASM